jgi:GPH family glycoside/pentoside/hexuronide:cation symporter
MSDVSEARKDKVGMGEIFAYGLGGVGRNLFYAITMMFLNYFYTNTIGMSAGIVGMVFMLSRVFDGITDVGFGAIMDKTHFKHGKARSWILWSALPFGISTMMLFTVPQISMAGKVVYLIITYNLVTSIFGTVYYTSYMTLPALMTRDRTVRTRLTIVNQLLASASMYILSLGIFPWIIKRGAAQRDWITGTAIIFPIGIAAMLIGFFFTKERIHESKDALADKDKGKPSLGLKTIFLTLIKNKYWFMVLGIFIFDALGNNFQAASGVYYSQYILNDTTSVGTISLGSGLATMAGLFLSNGFIKKLTKRQIFLVGAIIKTLGLALVIMLPDTVANMIIGRCISGFGMGLTFAVMYAFVPDTMEYGQWKTGIRLEGTMLSACSFGAKLGVGVAPGIAGLLMSAAAYDGLAKVQNEQALLIIRVCTTWLPMILAFVMILIMFVYDLDKKMDRILADLRERKNKSALPTADNAV